MIETTAEGFKLLVRTDGTREFMVDSDRLDECIEYVKRNDIRLIGLNKFLGYRKSEINFLSELTEFVEGIIITDKFADISILNSLHKVRTLGFADNGKSIIDLSNFPSLANLACDFSKRLVSLEVCEQMKDLTLTGFTSADKTLSEIPRLSSLKRLKLFRTNIDRLAGIGSFPILEELTVYKASHLADISALKDVKNTLKVLEFDSCKRISDYDTLGKISALKRLILVNSSDIPSLSFVKRLVDLEFLSFVGTRVIDGDLSPTIGIKYVGFDNKRHYSHTFEEVNRYRAG